MLLQKAPLAAQPVGSPFTPEACEMHLYILPSKTTVESHLARAMLVTVGVHVVSALFPQTLAVPPPPQVRGEVQAPHELTVRDIPQLSSAVTVPQSLPARAQKAPSLSGVQQTIWLDRRDARRDSSVWRMNEDK